MGLPERFIFASDLDRTLIYSASFLKNPDLALEDTQLVETLDGEPISHMTNRAATLLATAAERTCFVPVTTRTVAQYQRICFFQPGGKVLPDYAVTSNGGQILFRNKPDLSWHAQIKNRIANESLEDVLLKQKFLEIAHSSWWLQTKEAEDLFHYALIQPDQAPKDELQSFADWSQSVGWNVSLQGRKLYFVPKPVSKWAAVAEISSRTGLNQVLAAGDSLLDLPMLERANIAYALGHGEIMSVLNSPAACHAHIQTLPTKGIRGAEDLLERVIAIADGRETNQ